MIGVVFTRILLRDEPFTANKISGALIALLGIILIVNPSALAELSIINPVHLAVLGTTISYAFVGV